MPKQLCDLKKKISLDLNNYEISSLIARDFKQKLMQIAICILPADFNAESVTFAHHKQAMRETNPLGGYGMVLVPWYWQPTIIGI